MLGTTIKLTPLLILLGACETGGTLIQTAMKNPERRLCAELEQTTPPGHKGLICMTFYPGKDLKSNPEN